MWFILAQTSPELCVQVAMVTLGNILPRVLEVPIPRGLGTRERTHISELASLQVEDGVDGSFVATHSDHNSVLVRTHDF